MTRAERKRKAAQKCGEKGNAALANPNPDARKAEMYYERAAAHARAFKVSLHGSFDRIPPAS
jgi:hypothetical protein